MALKIQKLTKKKIRLRLALFGPTGSGKTYTSQMLAREIGDGRILVIDTENTSANRYADLLNPDGRMDTIVLPDYSPARYIEALDLAAEEGYPIVVIDSLSHAWSGRDGALDQVDKIARRGQSGGSFAAWREVTPEHNRLVEALLSYPGHLIVTMRAKMVYEVVNDDSGGRKSARVHKLGLSPVQRDGVEYEFDIVAEMDMNNNWVTSKTRCHDLAGIVQAKPGRDIARTIRAWLESGEEMAEDVDPRWVYQKLALPQEVAEEIKHRLKSTDGPPFADFLVDCWKAGARRVVDVFVRLKTIEDESSGDQEDESSGPAAPAPTKSGGVTSHASGDSLAKTSDSSDAFPTRSKKSSAAADKQRSLPEASA